MNAAPSTKTKLAFWLLWGFFSAYFAESLSASQPFAIIFPANILLLVPLYGLHSILLATIVIRFGRPRLYPLFFAGTIFGLYEAYITKVLWNPPWGTSINLGGIDVLSSLVLVLWWHAFIAFIIPLLALEEQTTSSHLVAAGLPPRIKGFLQKPRNLIILAAAAGVVQGSTASIVRGLVVANLVSPPLLFLLVWLWSRKQNRRFRLDELLPNPSQFRRLALLLGLIYLVLGLFMRPEALPGLLPQVMIWVLYVLFISLLLISMRRSKLAPSQEPGATLVVLDRPLLLKLWAAMAGSSLFTSILPFKQIFTVIHWFGGIAFGILILILAVKDAYQILILSPQGETNA